MSEVPGPGAYNVLPASRAATADVGQTEKLGRKVVGAWVKTLWHSKNSFYRCKWSFIQSALQFLIHTFIH